MMSSYNAKSFELCFVRRERDDEKGTDYLNLAYEAVEAKDLGPVWVNEEDCLNEKNVMGKVFVIYPFEGEVYRYLVSLKGRIVGPLCVLRCLQQSDTLPIRQTPVHSIIMRGITVTCSNVDKQIREDIHEKVQLMGGYYQKDLLKSVTHLISGEVGSKKYHVAANLGLPIMLPSWISELWNNGQYDLNLHASDSSFKNFVCPVFKGLSITVSQLGSTERNLMKSQIEQNGGHYSGVMKSKNTTHLVLVEPQGQKYYAAKSWKLFCVKTTWVTDSLAAGHCMDENLYMLESPEESVGAKRSTPVKGKGEEKLIIDCSVIVPAVSHVNETACTQNEPSILSLNNNDSNSFNILNSFDISSLPKNGQFLDGCKIYLNGFEASHLDKVRKIVNSGGGLRFSKYSESISHVVCGKKDSAFMESLKLSNAKPYIVHFQWLLECCKQQKLVDEGPFVCEEFVVADAPSVQIDNHDKPLKSAHSIGTNLTFGEDFTDILKQYSASDVNSSGRNSPKQLSTQHSNSFIKLDSLTALNKSANDKQEGQDNDLPTGNIPKASVNNEDITIDDKIATNSLFSRRLFMVLGFNQSDFEVLTGMINSHGGVVCDKFSNMEVDIAVVPLISNIEISKAKNVVTNCWLQKCIEDASLLVFSSNELFEPFNINKETRPLENMVISISQYAGAERDCLMHLVESLGGCCQSFFVRKANRSKGLLANTHLIALFPEGSKYKAAKNWKVPAVTKYWLFAAAKTGKAPSVENFVVGSEMANSTTFFSDLVSLSRPTVVETTLKSNYCEQEKNDINVECNNKTIHQFAIQNNCSNNDSELVAKRCSNLQNEQILQSSTPKVSMQEYNSLLKSHEVTEQTQSSTPKGSIQEFNSLLKSHEVTEQTLQSSTPKGSMQEFNSLLKSHEVTEQTPQSSTPKGSMQECNSILKSHEGTDKNDFIDNRTSTPAVAVQQITPIKWKEAEECDGNVESCKTTTPKLSLSNVTPQHDRIRKLIESNSEFSAYWKKNSPSQESPFNPKFDVSGILRALDSSNDPGSPWNKSYAKSFSPSLEDKLNRNLSLLLAKYADNDQSLPIDENNKQSSVDGENYDKQLSTDRDCDEKQPPVSDEVVEGATSKQKDKDSGMYMENQDKTILNGVVLCVSKKLSRLQLELNKLVKSLGGEYRWTFDNSCTHYIFQGKVNDLNKEFREARNLGKKIVSPDWLYACKEEEQHVNESCYPHTFKCNSSLLLHISTHSASASELNNVTFEENIQLDKQVDPFESPNKISGNEASFTKEAGDVSEQLDELILAAKNAKAAKRRASRNTGSDIHSESGRRNSPATPQGLYASRYARKSDMQNDPDIACTEPSQSVPITWDDPTGRMEREKIAALALPINSTNDCDEVFLKDMASADDMLCIDASPQPIEPVVPKKFMFSALDEKLVKKYTSMVNALGGEISDCRTFDKTATHLILNKLVRSEKFLGSVASGKWILHTSYIEDSASNNAFLSEELYEWGNKLSEYSHTTSDSMLKLCSSVFRWRIKLQNEKQLAGAFHGWKVIILAELAKTSTYSRILEAGGAQVLHHSSVFSDQIDATYAFVEISKTMRFDSELKALSSRNVKCLKPDFLACYLIDDPLPSADNPHFSVFPSTKDASVSVSSKRPQMNSHESRKKSRLI